MIQIEETANSNVIHGIKTFVKNGSYVTFWLEWNEELQVYEVTLAYVAPAQERELAIRRQRQPMTDKEREMCSTLFGAFNYAFGHVATYIAELNNDGGTAELIPA